MSAVDDYLRQLQGLLHVRGPMRRRVLGECGDHLRDASAQYGPNESVRRFGPAQEIAASVNTEVAARRAQRATAATAVGVLAVGASTLSLLHASGDGATAPVGWAVLFFAAAQVAALCTVLGVLQAIACRRQPSTAQEVALLCRRNGCALLAAGITMVAAGGAVPGRGWAVLLLAGPVLGVLAALGVLSARLIIRGHPAARQPLVCSPVHDLATLSGIPLPGLRPTRLLLLTVAVAAAAAFLWDHQDHGTPASALTTASIQAALVVLGFLILGPALGLRQSHRRT
jgi:hypothetical protein